MKWDKWYFYMIAIIIIALIAFAAGLQKGRSLAWNKCIDKVADNCEYICGVPRDNFYFPDQEQELENRLEELADPDSLIAKGD